jgi:hypothetical protein
VTTTPSYPQYSPGSPPNDKILILEDTNGDGKADTCKVFKDHLYMPTGIELGYGKVFVSEQPNLMVLEDTNGDDKADRSELILHGFDTADSHHACHAFVWDPGMALYFQEGTFLHTQIETPYGPVRSHNAANRAHGNWIITFPTVLRILGGIISIVGVKILLPMPRAAPTIMLPRFPAPSITPTSITAACASF